MAASDSPGGDDSLYPIAVLIDELRNEDVQVFKTIWFEGMVSLFLVLSHSVYQLNFCKS